jgi:hypothetical protein
LGHFKVNKKQIADLGTQNDTYTKSPYTVTETGHYIDSSTICNAIESSSGKGNGKQRMETSNNFSYDNALVQVLSKACRKW